MRQRVLALGFLAAVAFGFWGPGGSVVAAEGQNAGAGQVEEPLSRDAVDQILEGLFERHRDLEYLRAQVVQTRSGGVFRRPVQKEGVLKACLPDKMVLDMGDDGLFVLLDGTYVWLWDTDFDDVERYALGQYGESHSPGLAAIFLGADVATVEELRRLYKVTGTGAQGGTSFVLIPKKGELADRYRQIRLFLPDGALLPSRTELVGVRGKGTGEAPMTRYEVENVQSNLGGLEPYPQEAFVFPLEEGMTVRDMSREQGERALTYEEALRDIEMVGSGKEDG
jgi:outer membrane lipoprotein-sorting protein